jgi:hypothetical protein
MACKICALHSASKYHARLAKCIGMQLASACILHYNQYTCEHMYCNTVKLEYRRLAIQARGVGAPTGGYGENLRGGKGVPVSHTVGPPAPVDPDPAARHVAYMEKKPVEYLMTNYIAVIQPV